MVFATIYATSLPSNPTPTTTQLVQAGIALVTAYGLFPMLASYLFTVNHPQRRLVPPLLIQLAASALLAATALVRTGQSNFTAIALSGGVMSVLFCIIVFDGIMIRLLGRFVNRKDLETRVLTIEGDTMENVEQTLLGRGMRVMLHLRHESETTEHGTVLSTNEDSDFNCYIELSTNPLSRVVVMTMVFFEQGRYFTKTSDELVEYANRTVGYLVWRLMSLDRFVTASRERPTDDYTREVEERAVDSMRGMLDPKVNRTRREKRMTWVAAIAFALPIGQLVMEWGVTNNTIGASLAAIGIYATILTVDTTLGRRVRTTSTQ